ncbi:hypothetical protein DB345_19985 [Spartobacteria bacterium LR76]|nr:hypothetical protein DB345_19985 [Spartobacteria bacterium LR76]
MKPRSTPIKGAALIIALAIMVLVLALIFGILSRVQVERGVASGYASSISARIIAEDAVQVVQAQIDAATKQGTTVGWTSQPGLIRTFDTGGNAQKTYKLYSSPSLWTEGALVPAAEAATLSDWYKHPAIYTDLNMPADSDFDGTVDKWPILDPSSLQSGSKPEGFNITGAPAGASQGITNPAPMPVNWLYILQNGQMVAPKGSGDTATVPGASDANRIVGRVAFWTDDETCKINVNTASEGTYWDAPKFNTSQERDLARFQPAKNEFQAYPGHPATTSLSPVFPDLTREQIFQITPRLKNEGSMNGTVKVSDIAAAGLDQDRLFATEDELLFSNTFATARAENSGLTRPMLERGKFFLTTSSRAPETNLFNLPRVSCWPIHQTNSSDYRTPFDRLIAFCSTLNGQPYYFQRASAASPTDDYDKIARNKTLYAYLQTLMSRKFPGFGNTLSGKYGDDADQILTEIFDYIRSTNLYDGNLAKANRYATGIKANSFDNKTRLDYGVVEPIRIGDTKGFGRELSLTEAGIWFICTADPDVPASNNVDSNGNYVDYNKTLPGVDDPLTTWDDRILQNDDPVGTQQIRIEAAMLMELFTPMQGYAGLRPDIEIKIEGLQNLTVRGNADTSSVPLGFPPEGDQTENKAGRMIFGKYPHEVSGCFPTGGNMGLWWTLSGRGVRARNNGRLPQDSFFGGSSDGGTGVTKNRQYPFVSEPVTIRVSTSNPSLIFSGGRLTFKVLKRASGDVVQKVTADLPGGTFPAPLLHTVTRRDAQTGEITYPAQKKWTFQAEGAGLNNDDGNGVSAGRLGGSFGGTDFFVLEQKSDVVLSIVPVDKEGNGADLRVLVAESEDIGTSSDTHFAPHPLYHATSKTERLADSFTEYSRGWSVHFIGGTSDTFAGKLANMTQNYANGSHPDTPLPVPAAQATGDWDNGLTNDSDGPYINKPDEGNTYIKAGEDRVPYYTSYGEEVFDVSNFFSPNRIIPSAGMFGSLSTGVKRQRHWETLLFRRQPGHPNYTAAAGGFIANPDYLLLDLFWMPIVEPYAISEPLSTAGKINLNQQIVPFTWVQRNTGLYAVLKQEKVVSVPNTDASVYKSGGTDTYRRPINIPDTLKQLDFRFSNADGTGLYAFRTPAEICDMHIIPNDATVDMATKASLDQSMANYWAGHALTGDNSRERIYTTVYPRLTTRSNTYTVYYRAQSLKKRPGTNQEVWEEGKDIVTGDYRGSTTLERFINPANTDIQDYAVNPEAEPSLDTFYRWRQRSNRQFAP